VPVGNWLATVGATDVRFAGDAEGPPDYLVRFGGEELAVEVTRMLDGKGWSERQRIAFQCAPAAVVKMVAKEINAPRWHVGCEYDPRVPRPSKPNGARNEFVKESFRAPGPGGAVQMIPDGLRVGRGVVLGYTPAGNAGGFSGVSMDTGNRPASTAGDRIVDVTGASVSEAREPAFHVQGWLPSGRVWDRERLSFGPPTPEHINDRFIWARCARKTWLERSIDQSARLSRAAHHGFVRLQ